ncbi:unnamed protein product [Closterium sp. Naga37s-1]|nr:unnamed protein product [Closterium sp. Naga37s-1]
MPGSSQAGAAGPDGAYLVTVPSISDGIPVSPSQLSSTATLSSVPESVALEIDPVAAWDEQEIGVAASHSDDSDSDEDGDGDGEFGAAADPVTEMAADAVLEMAEDAVSEMGTGTLEDLLAAALAFDCPSSSGLSTSASSASPASSASSRSSSSSDISASFSLGSSKLSWTGFNPPAPPPLPSPAPLPTAPAWPPNGEVAPLRHEVSLDPHGTPVLEEACVGSPSPSSGGSLVSGLLVAAPCSPSAAAGPQDRSPGSVLEGVGASPESSSRVGAGAAVGAASSAVAAGAAGVRPLSLPHSLLAFPPPIRPLAPVWLPLSLSLPSSPPHPSPLSLYSPVPILAPTSALSPPPPTTPRPPYTTSSCSSLIFLPPDACLCHNVAARVCSCHFMPAHVILCHLMSARVLACLLVSRSCSFHAHSNKTAKLKQSKLDARREQFLAQVAAAKTATPNVQAGPLEEAGKAKEAGDDQSIDQSIGDSVSGAGCSVSLANGILEKRRGGEEQRNGEENREGDRGNGGAADEGGGTEEGGAEEEAEEKQWWEDSDDDEGHSGEGEVGTGGLRDGDGVVTGGERDRVGSGGSSTGKAAHEDSGKSRCEEGGQLEKAPHVQEAGQLKEAPQLEKEEEAVVVEILVEAKVEGTCESAAAAAEAAGERESAGEKGESAAVEGLRGLGSVTEAISTGTAVVVAARVVSVSDGSEEGSNGRKEEGKEGEGGEGEEASGGGGGKEYGSEAEN